MSTPLNQRIVNILTFDIEDYFQVSAFDRVLPRSSWDGCESRVCQSTDRLLQMLSDADVKATCFVLGWVAERFPDLVARIAAEGHEIASHGSSHRLVYEMTPDEFREDIRRSKRVLEAAGAGPVLGYRAPSYSVVERSLWALDVLIEEGFVYDASIFPIHHDRYGIPSAPRHPYRITRKAGSIWEVPPSTVRCFGANLPIAGGGYFRLLPYAWTRWGIRRLNIAEERPAVFYLHPWELDPEQPRLAVGRLTAFRHYRNLAVTGSRLRRLLKEFPFAPAATVLEQLATAAAPRALRYDRPVSASPVGALGAR
jgi:polysaccharide deacetylase family protein (PEP-CTERM system associated)